MIEAAQPAFLVAREDEGCAPVRAIFVEHPDATLAVAEYDKILAEKGVTCTPTYWSERDDWTLAMVAAGLGFAFMPANAVNHPGVIGVPLGEPEFWRRVNLVTVRGRKHSPGIGALVREALRKPWFGMPALAASQGRVKNDALVK